MASIVTRKNGHYWIQVRVDRVRKTVRLGPVSRKIAEQCRGRIEALNACRIAGMAPDEQTAAWVRSLSPEMSSRLAASGLIERKAAYTLTELLDYIWSQLRVKDSTEASYAHVRRNLLEFFGPDRPIASLNQGDGDEFYRHLQTIVSKATAAGRSRRARQFFVYAIKKRWITENPFAGLRVGSQTNEERLFYVTKEMVDELMPQLPNSEYRLFVALGRYAGLRLPSEALALQWQHIDWDKGLMRIEAPKTGCRMVPVFSSLRPFLEAQWEESEGSQWVMFRHRLTVQAYSSIISRAIERAGMVQWPRLLQQLRSSCESDLIGQFPLPVVVKWLGHSIRIAERHYIQVVDSHVEAATGRSISMPKGAASELERFRSLCSG